MNLCDEFTKILTWDEYQTLFVQVALWSWRVLLFLWWREKLWLWAAETRRCPSISQLISIKMDSTSAAAPQETRPSAEFPCLMKDSTNVTSQESENQQRAGWLSEVRPWTGSVMTERLSVITNHSECYWSIKKKVSCLTVIKNDWKSFQHISAQLCLMHIICVPSAEQHLHTRPCPDQCCHIYVILRTVFTIMMVALLLLLVGLLQCGKLRATRQNSSPPNKWMEKISWSNLW